MSLIATMTTAALVAGLTLTEVSLAAVVANELTEGLDEGLETIFTDMELMRKTFAEMDCHVEEVSENEIYVKTTCGNLRYSRYSAEDAFRLYLDDISDTEGLIQNIRSFEIDYGRNVQEYTYNHIKSSLEANMSIENEYYEGDELYITINIEE